MDSGLRETVWFSEKTDWNFPGRFILKQKYIAVTFNYTLP
jgi:hypothetical protein